MCVGNRGVLYYENHRVERMKDPSVISEKEYLFIEKKNLRLREWGSVTIETVMFRFSSLIVPIFVSSR